MHEVSEEEIGAIYQPMALFIQKKEFEYMVLVDAKTTPTKNYQDNGALPLLGTQPSSLHSPLTDALVSPDRPPPRPRVEDRDSVHLARAADLPDSHLKVAINMLYRVYRDWVHKNTGNHMDGGIKEDSNCQARQKKMSVCQSRNMTHPMVKSGKRLSQIYQWSLTAYNIGSGTQSG